MQSFPRKIRVDLAAQQLELLEEGRVLRRFPVSSSGFGHGSEPGSLKTPLGRFAVAEMIGESAPLGTVFKSRTAVGQIPTFANPGDPEDLVLSRILWLDGLEPHNANTRERYIYIHGTNHEERIGEPASHGCIRMRNADVVVLFEMVTPGTEVEIG